MLLGTSHGVLDLWDLRFKVRLKAWGVPGTPSIYRMSIHPSKGKGKWVCVAGGSAHGEVTAWDVEKTQCREVYRSGGSRDGPKTYEPWPVDEDIPEGMLGRFATALEPTSSGSTDRGVRAMAVGGLEDVKHGFILTGGSDKKIRFWDLARVENSMVVSGLAPDELKPTFSSQSIPPLVLSTEKVSRHAPTALNAGTGTKLHSGKANGVRPPRSTVISLQQQQLLKSHLDSILDMALLESPYGMIVTVDRSGVIFVFQ